MAFDASGNECNAPRDEQRAGAVLHDFAGALERCEPDVECAALARADLEPARELVRRERRAGALERAQDVAPILE